MSCLDNIVTISGCDGQAPSVSGYDLMNAPEITIKNLAKVANEKYVSGLQMAKSILNLSILDVKSDFLQVLSANRFATDVSSPVHQSSEFRSTTTFPAVTKERGIVFYKNLKGNPKLRKTTITKVSVYPLVNVASAIIKVYDNGLLYSYPTTLTGNLVNTIEINHVVQGTSARIVVDGTNMPVGSALLTCFIGCGGTIPNSCGYTKGYNGDGEISSKEGFGIGIDFKCECDYEQLLCDLSKSYTGKLIYLKARIGLLDERLNTDRLNGLVLYDREQAESKRIELEGEYADQWNVLVQSLPNLLMKYQGECITCRGIRIVTNI